MSDQKHVLIKWKDGWQEVVAVEADAICFDKYYVIERIEHFGRLVIKRPKGDYPGLIVIDRAPMEVEKIVLMDEDDERSLKQSSTYREGNKLEYNYELQKSPGAFIEELSNNVKEALAKKGISARDVLSKPHLERFKEIENIAKAVHIVASKKQDEVVGFITLLLEKML
ncbi:MAG: hypothetical protein V2A69_16445 [Pseudomonadota bacterium]